MLKRWNIVLISALIILSTFTTVVAERYVELYVSAAISLKDVLMEIQTDYQAKHSNLIISFNFGSSGVLQNQIEQGAPVDLFISAALKQMDTLEQKGLIIKETRRDLLRNQLVLIVLKDSNLKLKDFKDLESEKVKNIGIGAPGSVPAGQYALLTLESLGRYRWQYFLLQKVMT